VRFSRNQEKFGTLQRDLPWLKDAIDYRLTKAPSLYLFVERFREWVNWDKRVYLSFVRSGDVVLDVGANVGAHAVFLSHLVGERGRVIAFEPLPANVAALDQTIERRARYRNIRVLAVAVGNPSPDEKRVTIKIPGNDRTQASLTRQTAGSWASNLPVTEITVPLKSLDSTDDVQSLGAIDFVKIDVEGGELDVLRGAASTISRHLPFVYCEAHDKWQASFGYRPADLIDFARSLGYSSARVVSRGKLHPLRLDQVTPSSLFATSADILFFADKHRKAVERFDRRYQVRISSR
jgi:FkbM family methyltransferase